MTILLLAGLLQAGPPAPPPVVTPFFLSRNVEEGPAFFVECRNTTGAPISSGSRVWPLDEDAIRIDGAARERRGRMGPGLVMDILPGGTWRGIIELRQAEPQSWLRRLARRRTPAARVRCPADARTATRSPSAAATRGPSDLPFYWER